MVKVIVTIKATFEVEEADVKLVKAATPENQLATARISGGRVNSTTEVK
jgi:hypothetical protein